MFSHLSAVILVLEVLSHIVFAKSNVSSQFYLVLDVANLTSQEMELQYTPTKTMLIEGEESCRVPIPVDRCPLSKLFDFYNESKESNISNIDVNAICSEHITNLVQLHWKLLATDSKGVASLKGINLTTRMLDIVRTSPLDWEMIRKRKVENVDDIVKATVVPHDYCKIKMAKDKASDMYSPPGFVDVGNEANGAWRQEQTPLKSVGRVGAKVARREVYRSRDILAEYIISDIGKVTWQRGRREVPGESQ